MTFEHDPFEAGPGVAVGLESARDSDVGRWISVATRASASSYPSSWMSPGLPLPVESPCTTGETSSAYVTSAAYGYTIDAGIAYAWVPLSHSSPGTAMNIGYFGESIPATLAEEPLYDPSMSRLRG